MRVLKFAVDVPIAIDEVVAEKPVKGCVHASYEESPDPPLRQVPPTA